jgi:hypothetical protein
MYVLCCRSLIDVILAIVLHDGIAAIQIQKMLRLMRLARVVRLIRGLEVGGLVDDACTSPCVLPVTPAVAATPSSCMFWHRA